MTPRTIDKRALQKTRTDLLRKPQTADTKQAIAKVDQLLRVAK